MTDSVPTPLLDAELPPQALDSVRLQAAALRRGLRTTRLSRDVLIAGPTERPDALLFKGTSGTVSMLVGDAITSNAAVLRSTLAQAGMPLPHGAIISPRDFREVKAAAAAIGYPLCVEVPTRNPASFFRRTVQDEAGLRKIVLNHRRGDTGTRGRLVLTQPSRSEVVTFLVFNGQTISSSVPSDAVGETADASRSRVAAEAVAAVPGLGFASVDLEVGPAGAVVRGMRAAPALEPFVRHDPSVPSRIIDLHLDAAGVGRAATSHHGDQDLRLRIEGATDPHALRQVIRDRLVSGDALDVIRDEIIDDAVLLDVRGDARQAAALSHLAVHGDIDGRTTTSVDVHIVGGSEATTAGPRSSSADRDALLDRPVGPLAPARAGRVEGMDTGEMARGRTGISADALATLMAPPGSFRRSPGGAIAECASHHRSSDLATSWSRSPSTTGTDVTSRVVPSRWTWRAASSPMTPI